MKPPKHPLLLNIIGGLMLAALIAFFLATSVSEIRSPCLLHYPPWQCTGQDFLQDGTWHTSHYFDADNIAWISSQTPTPVK